MSRLSLALMGLSCWIFAAQAARAAPGAEYRCALNLFKGEALVFSGSAITEQGTYSLRQFPFAYDEQSRETSIGINLFGRHTGGVAPLAYFEILRYRGYPDGAPETLFVSPKLEGDGTLFGEVEGYVAMGSCKEL